MKQGPQKPGKGFTIGVRKSINNAAEASRAKLPYYHLKDLPPLPPQRSPFQPPSLLHNQTPLGLHGMTLPSDAPKTEAYSVIPKIPDNIRAKEITM